MISSEKNSAGPTSRQAEISVSIRCCSGSGALPFAARWRSSRLWAFSTITTAASISSPIAMAMPPRLMMLELMPSARMQMNENSTASGSTTITTSAERACSRNSAHTSATMIDSSTSVSVSVSIARWISSERS